MKPTDRTKKLIFAAFIVSLLVHIGSMLYFWLPGTPTQAANSVEEKKVEQQQKEIKKEEPWAATQAGGGNAGAPVFFQDEPEEREEEEPTQEKEDPAPQEQPTPKPAELERNIDITEPEKITAQTEPLHETTTIQSAKITKPEKTKPPIQQQLKQPVQPRQTTMPPAKKIPSLAELTQGYMNHVKGEGKHLVSMLGPKKGLPSEEQMKYERYLQKLSTCLSTSFAIHRDAFSLSSRIEDDTSIFVSLNQDGTPRKISLQQSSGNKKLDDFVLFVFRDASTSFPPVPAYLPHNPFTITFIVQTKTPEQSNVRIRIG